MPNLKSNGKEHQCFPLNDSDGYVQGIEELVAVYRQSIHYLKFGSITILNMRKDIFFQFFTESQGDHRKFSWVGPKRLSDSLGID